MVFLIYIVAQHIGCMTLPLTSHVTLYESLNLCLQASVSFSVNGTVILPPSQVIINVI